MRGFQLEHLSGTPEGSGVSSALVRCSYFKQNSIGYFDNLGDSSLFAPVAWRTKPKANFSAKELKSQEGKREAKITEARREGEWV